MSNLDLKAHLSAQELAMVSSELEHVKKSVALGYVLWFFLGGFGGHRFYLGKTGTAIAQFVSCLLLVGVIWVLVDAFLLYGWIQRYNEEKERQIVEQILSRRVTA